MSADGGRTGANARYQPPPEQKSSGVSRIRRIALVIGIALFGVTLYVVDLRAALDEIRALGLALPAAIAISGAWHVTRTWAWAWCFPQPGAVSFATLVRVRFAAEAFSYVTLRGVAGEPLKVVLLAGAVDARETAAAVALERVAYTVVTLLIVGIGAVIAIALLPLTHVWFRIFRAFAITAAVVAILSAIAIGGRGTYLRTLMEKVDRRTGWSIAGSRAGRFIASVERIMLELVRSSPARLAVLVLSTVASFALMMLETWVILRAAGAPVGIADAAAVETFSRVAAFLSFAIPANLGALEATSVAAAAAIGTSGGAALAVGRRVRGLFWAAVGLMIYPGGRASRVR